MRKFNINKLIEKVIEESLQEKADDLVGKIKTKMNDDWNPNAPVNISNMEEDFDFMDDDMSSSDDYVMDKLDRECKDNPNSFGCKKHKEYAGVDMEMDEELIGGQKKLDKNKNGKLDGQDFKMLRKDRREGSEMCENCGGNIYEGECSECGYNGGMMDEEVEEGNEFTGELEKARKEHKKSFNVGGKTYPVKESIQLSENEMIDLIEKIVLEQKKAKGMAETEKVLKASKKENDQYIKDVTKKMKDYLKDMSSGDNYNTNPEEFPMSNHEINKKNNTMSYHPSDAVEEYIDAFAHPGMTNLTFDEIKPDDKRIDKYLKGDSTTGNAVKDKKGKALGNVVPSKLGDKFKKNYDNNLYGAEQKDASYKRQSQPVDVAGNEKVTGSLKKLRSNPSKAQKVLDKVDESSNKKTKLVNEEFERIKKLMNYDKSTQ